MKRKFHSSDKYHIEYWDNELNDKPVFVMIHGLGAKTKYQWYEQLVLLKNNYRLIIPNLLHFGDTLPVEEMYDVQDQVDMIQFLLKKLEVSRYHLMGASYGGLISGEIANNYPDQVERLILVDAAIKYLYGSDEERVQKLFDVPSIPEFFVPDSYLGLRKLVAASVGKEGIVPPALTMPRFHDELYSKNFDDKRKIVEHLMNIREQYAKHEYKFPMPVHLIWGEYDQLVPPDRGQLFWEHLNKKATFDIIKGGGHMPNMNKSRAFNKLLKSYLGL